MDEVITVEDYIAHALLAVAREFERARKLYPPMHSAHEGYAIIKEELDELWTEIKRKDGLRDVERMREEVVQVGAMAVRFLVDVCGEEANHG